MEHFLVFSRKRTEACMGKKLIIVESPAKVKTIRKFLGPDFMVEASVGHVCDLPASELGVDEEHDFTPHYEIIPDKRKVVEKLQSAAKRAQTVYLAPDPDREGEAIAWHIAALLYGRNLDVRRIQFNEITKRAVLEALERPRELDDDLFDAQQARRILDRLAGFKLSQLLWKKVKRGISAGRVQSVALRIVVDRELEREAFRPEEYWVFKARVSAPSGGELLLDLARVGGRKRVIGGEEEARALEAELRGAPFLVSSVESKRRETQPRAPFTTSTLQQAASQRLGFSPRRTMGVAQRLYEGVEMGDGNVTALITYMRTDSTRVADEARDAASAFVARAFGPDYLPAQRRSYKVKAQAQDAHEAIRPVDVNLTPDELKSSLSEEQHRLYSLVWARFLASQMAAAAHLDTTVTVRSGRAERQARGRRLLIDGRQRELPEDREALLPELGEGDELGLLQLSCERKFTQPPARYSEAGLVRALEELGIGRPSTYAATVSTLEDRAYVERRQGSLAPTELGRAVCGKMLEGFPRLMDTHFTAGMEGDLDKVAEGRKGWVELLADFAADFNPALAEAAKSMASLKGGVPTELSCPECGKPLLLLFGKAGPFLSCSGKPDCGFSCDCERDAQGRLSPVRRVPQVVGSCPECGADLVVRRARKGARFVGCSAYPACAHTEPYSTGVPCPKCGKGSVVEKSSKKGRIFYSCDTYPACDFALWNEPVARACPACGSPYMLVKATKRGTSLVCPERSCGHVEPLPGEAAQAEEGGES